MREQISSWRVLNQWRDLARFCQILPLVQVAVSVFSQRRSRLSEIFHPIKALIRIFKYLRIDQCKIIQVYSYLNSSSRLVTDTLAGDLKTREIRGELINRARISYALLK